MRSEYRTVPIRAAEKEVGAGVTDDNAIGFRGSGQQGRNSQSAKDLLARKLQPNSVAIPRAGQPENLSEKGCAAPYRRPLLMKTGPHARNSVAMKDETSN